MSEDRINNEEKVHLYSGNKYKKLTIEELSERAEKIIALIEEMDNVFPHKRENLKMAIMAAIADAYNEGKNGGI